MTDKELIQNMKNREEESLGLLIDRYGGYVAAVISGVSCRQISREDAEELAADVFVAFWENVARFDEGQEVRPYLPLASGNSYSRDLETSRILQTSSFSRIIDPEDADYVLVDGTRYDFNK